MRKNSFDELLDIMGHEGSKRDIPSIKIGEVKSIEPLQVSIGNLTLNDSNFYISKSLSDYSETIEIDGASKTITHKSIIENNDIAFLYPVEDGQKYILLGVAK